MPEECHCNTQGLALLWRHCLNSDHKPDITRLRMDRLHLVHKHHTKGTGQLRTDIAKLCKDPSVQQERIRNDCIAHWPNTNWARTQMIIWRLQQQRRSESSKEGPAHNIQQQIPQPPSHQNNKRHWSLTYTNTAKVKTALPFGKSATRSCASYPKGWRKLQWKRQTL